MQHGKITIQEAQTDGKLVIQYARSYVMCYVLHVFVNHPHSVSILWY